MFVHNDEVHWDMNFIILVHDWEVDTITFFFQRSILLGGFGEMKINVVGSLQKEDILRSKYFTKFSFPTSTILALGRAFRGLRLL
jgi:hypothetical protein